MLERVNACRAVRNLAPIPATRWEQLLQPVDFRVSRALTDSRGSAWSGAQVFTCSDVTTCWRHRGTFINSAVSNSFGAATPCRAAQGDGGRRSVQVLSSWQRAAGVVLNRRWTPCRGVFFCCLVSLCEKPDAASRRLCAPSPPFRVTSRRELMADPVVCTPKSLPASERLAARARRGRMNPRKPPGPRAARALAGVPGGPARLASSSGDDGRERVRLTVKFLDGPPKACAARILPAARTLGEVRQRVFTETTAPRTGGSPASTHHRRCPVWSSVGTTSCTSGRVSRRSTSRHLR